MEIIVKDKILRACQALIDVFGGAVINIPTTESSMVDLLAELNGIIYVLRTPNEIGHINNTSVSNVAATQISSTSHPCKKCVLTSANANTGYLLVGGSGVTAANGILLYPGDSVDFEIDNTNKLYAIAENNGEDIQVTYFN